jgi:(2Fe-2S) ferredoxin
MRAITEGGRACALAVAEPHLLVLREGEFYGRFSRTLVSTITERLVSTHPTGAPPVVSSF